MTAWKPVDTCGCEFLVEDWDLPRGKTVATCPVHLGLVDDDHLRVVYHGEHRVKNLALADLYAAAPSLFLTAAEAATTNRARLEVFWPTARPRIVQLTDAEVVTALRALGTVPIADLHHALPGVEAGYRFTPGAAPGEARIVEFSCPAMAAPDRARFLARVARFGSGKVRLL